jgi:hypothetical protein
LFFFFFFFLFVVKSFTVVQSFICDDFGLIAL